MPDARALVLDIGGVVLLNARELLATRGLDVAGPDDERWHAMLRHEITERAYWSERAAQVGQSLGEPGWTTRHLINWLYDRPEEDWVNDEVLDLMRDTTAAGIPLVALTNDLVDFHGQAWADAQEWLKPFDTIVDGSVTGILKPDPRAYELAIEAVGVPAREIVYLDDMPVNVRGGVEAGMQSIEVLYDNRHAAVDKARHRLGLEPREGS